MGLKENPAGRDSKLQNLIIYLSSLNMPFMCKKKLAKLLYFIDFTYYEKDNRPITDLVYEKRQYGPMPTPTVFYSTLETLEKEDKLKLDKPDLNSEVIVPVAQVKPNTEVFSGDEFEIIKIIKEKYFSSTAKELEDIAKNEPPYKMTKYREKIPYHLAYYRNSFGEMDLEGDGDEGMDSR
jgi:uncharacterized phage-associated protein